MIAGILLVGIIAVTLTGCKHTDSSKKETEKPVITLGMNDHIAKPIQVDKLLSTLKTILTENIIL